MKRKRYTEEQIVGILKAQEAGVKVSDLVRAHGMSEPEFLPLDLEHDPQVAALDIARSGGKAILALERELQQQQLLLAYGR